MKLRLTRHWITEESCIGELYLEDARFCFTLEDPPRPVKIPGKTAIPLGTYSLTLSWSPRFKEILPLLAGVPEFEGVRIHAGNTAEDTEGCILVGNVRAENRIIGSRATFSSLMARLTGASGPHTITIEEG